jgi:NAD(P)-dependent dehydrogenase (short-subunit alcohol dehydrogenase family)
MYHRLDALVNNAGIATFPPETSTKEILTQSFLVNATGVQLVTDAFKPLLQKSTHTPRIDNVSSGAGSVSIRLDPTFDHPLIGSVVHYRASKAAENMIAANMFRELDPLGEIASFGSVVVGRFADVGCCGRVEGVYV